jgi:hypothetical protein
LIAPRDRVIDDYRPALLAYLGHPDEEHLHSAYRLGRTSLTAGVTLLDLIRVHHTVLGPILATAPRTELPGILDGAAVFLLEALAPYDIARSGFLEQTTTPPRSGPQASSIDP